jgi:hypothetical protein
VIPIVAARRCGPREDIPLLAEHFLEKYSAQMEKPVNAVSRPAMELLQNTSGRATSASSRTSSSGPLRWRVRRRCSPKACPRPCAAARRA